MTSFQLVNGKPRIDKDPDARLLYGVDLSDWVADAGTTLAAVEAITAGVVADGAAFIQGNLVCAWVKGGDADAEENSCTFRFTGADGSIDDRTLYFKIKER